MGNLEKPHVPSNRYFSLKKKMFLRNSWSRLESARYCGLLSCSSNERNCWVLLHSSFTDPRECGASVWTAHTSQRARLESGDPNGSLIRVMLWGCNALVKDLCTKWRMIHCPHPVFTNHNQWVSLYHDFASWNKLNWKSPLSPYVTWVKGKLIKLFLR